MKKNTGFTLIELMIVVAIIAILAALAISQYQDYVTKAQFTESSSIVDGLKASVGEYVMQNALCPGNATGAISKGFLPNSSYAGKYIAKVDLTSSNPPCVIIATFKGTGSVSKPLVGQAVTFTVSDNGGTYSWACSTASSIPDKYKPAVCR